MLLLSTCCCAVEWCHGWVPGALSPQASGGLCPEKLKKSKSSLGASRWYLCEVVQHFLQPKNYAKCSAMHLNEQANTKKSIDIYFEQRIISISKFNSSAYACLDNNCKNHGRHPIVAVLQVQAVCNALHSGMSVPVTEMDWVYQIAIGVCLRTIINLLLQSSKRKMNDMNALNNRYIYIYWWCERMWMIWMIWKGTRRGRMRS